MYRLSASVSSTAELIAKSYAMGRSVMFQLALPELQFGDLSAEGAEGGDALDDARVVALHTLVELEEDQMADHGHS